MPIECSKCSRMTKKINYGFFSTVWFAKVLIFNLYFRNVRGFFVCFVLFCFKKERKRELKDAYPRSCLCLFACTFYIVINWA